MTVSRTELWASKLAEMKANRHGRIPKDRAVEERLAEEMLELWEQLSPAEQGAVERPEPPRYRDSPMDLIALNDRGYLIGFEEDPGDECDTGGYGWGGD
jgi:hypothetical protein